MARKAAQPELMPNYPAARIACDLWSKYRSAIDKKQNVGNIWRGCKDSEATINEQVAGLASQLMSLRSEKLVADYLDALQRHRDCLNRHYVVPDVAGVKKALANGRTAFVALCAAVPKTRNAIPLRAYQEPVV